MSEYKVLITETWKRAVTVDAESREEAEAAVRCQYKKWRIRSCIGGF